MGWMKVEEHIGLHPKHLRVEPAASFLWICGIGYCRSNLTDGFISDVAIDHLGNFKKLKPEKLAIQLTAVGLWRRDDDAQGWWVNDYHAMNPTKAEVLEVRAKDSARKKGKESNGNPAGIQKESERLSRAQAPEIYSSLSSLSGSEEGSREAPQVEVMGFGPLRRHPLDHAPGEPFPSGELAERANVFLGRFAAAHQRIRNSRFMGKADRDFRPAMQLVSGYSDAELAALTDLFLRATGKGFDNESRTPGWLAVKAAVLEERLKEVGQWPSAA